MSKKKNKVNALNQIQQIQKNMQVPMQTQLQTRSTGSTIKILAWGASPLVITGFGVVMKEILINLFNNYKGKYEIRQVGINYFGDAFDANQITGSPSNGIYQQWPAMQAHTSAPVHQYGQHKFLQLLSSIDPRMIDTVFLFEDPFLIGGNILGANEGFIDKIKDILNSRGLGHVPIVAYFPIDGIPKAAWLNNINKVEFPITYLNFGRKLSIEACPEIEKKLSSIPHGINTKEFFTISKEESRRFRRVMFGDAFVDKFMCLNVNRNQPRKMLPATLMAFAEFKKVIGDNTFLYMNMKPVDVGWNLPEICSSLGLVVGKDVIFPPNFNVQVGLSITELNQVFNTADLLLTSATGGGWEFALTQAFATKTCVIAPANTSHTELCGDQHDMEKIRGVLYESGNTLSLKCVFSNDNDVIRPLPNVEDMVQKMLFIYHNPEVKAKIENNAYNWVISTINWDTNIVPMFDQVFSYAYNLKNKREQEILNQRRAVQQSL